MSLWSKPLSAPDAQGGSGGGFEAQEQPGAPGQRRQTSMSLRAGGGVTADEASLMDPANQSLSEAIGITFGFLQIAMLVLLVLYAFSGAQYVKEGEKGISLLFGEVRHGDIDPGFRLSAPYPLGELLRVQTGLVEVVIDDVFWVDMPAGTPADTPPEKLTATGTIKPMEKSGSLLTADGSIAHAKVKVQYRRTDATRYAHTVLPGHEQKLVREAAQRGVVHAIAQTTIADLLAPPDGRPAAAERAQALAQEFLTRLETGITIDALTIERPMAPLLIRSEFASIQTEQAKGNQFIQQAQGEAERELNATAGTAATYIAREIDAYERASEKDRAPILVRIDDLLEGRKVICKDKVKGNNGVVQLVDVEVENQTSGAAAGLLVDARTYRSELVALRKGDRDTFKTKLDTFKKNPTLMINNEWRDAFGKFLANETTQVMLMPPGTSQLQLFLNPDPDVMKEIDKALKTIQMKKNEAERNKEFEKSKFDTKTGGITATPG
jgi:membrane protease subunit HflK